MNELRMITLIVYFIILFQVFILYTIVFPGQGNVLALHFFLISDNDNASFHSKPLIVN
jgi:hypothetical protein